MKLAAFIFGSMSLLIQQYADKYRKTDFDKTLSELEPDLSLPKIATYDFIIVGGGTAGCLLAGRLSEHASVLLLEAGGNPVPATYSPFLYEAYDGHRAINNIFMSVPQHNFAQATDGIIKTSAGRMLGGSGSHNGNVYNRGSPRDYDFYANVTGDSSWKYKNILKYFKNFENYVGQLVSEEERREFYGVGGPFTIETDTPPILQTWFEAGAELGFKSVDPNGHQTQGFTPMAKSIEDGERTSSYTAFIKPIEGSRKSLTVLRYSVVEKILINKNKVAYGVAFKRHGIPQIAHANKEVILSCGTFSSPMLLIKSGIGPKEILHQANIKVYSDLPGVGQNFRDHAAVILEFTAKSPNKTFLPQFDDLELQQELKKYQKLPRTGLFAALNQGPQALIVSSRAEAEGEEDWPDIQLVFQSVPVFKKNAPQLITFNAVANRLKSVGEIGFNVTAYLQGERDDTKLALVDYKLFTEESDIQQMLEAIKWSFKIMEETKAFKNMDVHYTETPPKACKSMKFRSEDFWRCYIKQRPNFYFHVTGTCKMGRNDDPMAVVDSKLRVRGINNLRVVDASVLPQPTNVNINAAVLLTAEKTAQEIISLYKSGYQHDKPTHHKKEHIEKTYSL